MNEQKVEETTKLLINLGISYAPKAFVGLLFIAVGVLVGRSLGKRVDRWLEKRSLEPPVRTLIGRAVRVASLSLFVIMALQNFGVELLPLIAGLGVAGVGVSLALQGVLQNLSAGLTIIFTKPFRIGEYVRLLGVHGEVVSIELFATTLRQSDMANIVIPNKKIIGEILHNHGKIRQLDLRVAVAYTVDVGNVLAAVNEAIIACPQALREPRAAVGLTQLSDSSIVVGVAPWVNVPDYGSATSALYLELLERFRVRGVSLPGPHTQVRLEPMG